jgi:hypothetical protein
VVAVHYFGGGAGFCGLCSEKLVQVFLSSWRDFGVSEQVQFFGFAEGPVEVY